MADSVLKLRTEAKNLGIENYRKMSASQLRNAIERANTGEIEPQAENGGNPKRKSAKAVKGATKRKTAKRVTKAVTKRAPAKRAAQKSAPAAKSRTRGEAKRPTATKRAATKQPTRARGRHAGRNLIDNTEIDWSAESPVGNSGGNRGIIVKALRKFKGDQKKVFAHLQPQAKEMYPKSSTTGERYSKAKAESLLKWHISRVKFDFVMSTGQHQKSKYRAANGTSTDPQAIQRRKATKQRAKAAGGRRSPARATKAKPKAKSRPAAKRRSQGRTAARRSTTARARARAKR